MTFTGTVSLKRGRKQAQKIHTNKFFLQDSFFNFKRTPRGIYTVQIIGFVWTSWYNLANRVTIRLFLNGHKKENDHENEIEHEHTQPEWT
jgi:hypothetical protein